MTSDQKRFVIFLATQAIAIVGAFGIASLWFYLLNETKGMVLLGVIPVVLFVMLIIYIGVRMEEREHEKACERIQLQRIRSGEIYPNHPEYGKDKNAPLRP